jgi:hypothetical protein
LRASRASGSVVLWCVSLLRFSPLKSTISLRPPPAAPAPGSSSSGGGGASFGRKLFSDALASSSVPSTVKWSRDSSFLAAA